MKKPEATKTRLENNDVPPRAVTRIFRRDLPLPLPPRKWPVQDRASVTVDAILEATAQLLEDGRSISTNMIAERAGVSIGTLYQYFDGKDAIVAALSRQVREALVLAVSRATVAARHEPLHAGLRMIILAAMAGDIERPNLARALDQLETVLPLQADHAMVQIALQTSLTNFLTLQAPNIVDRAEVIADDMCAVTRALTDAARSRCETPDDQLVLRITNALAALIAGLR